MENANFLISSGWFSDINKTTDQGIITSEHQKHYGGNIGRNTIFSKYWLNSILNQSVQPQKIIILDAKSVDPLHESILNNNFTEIQTQTQNFGHGVTCSKNNILCGWARGVLFGAMSAFVNDINFVYVEQDLLMFGTDFIANIFKEMDEQNKNICYMTGDETPQKLQQSLIIVKKEFLHVFISHLVSFADNTISEEKKHYELFSDDIMWCPFKGGRQRKKLDETNYCLQHINAEELAELLAKYTYLDK